MARKASHRIAYSKLSKLGGLVSSFVHIYSPLESTNTPRTLLATTLFSTLIAHSENLQRIPKSLRYLISLGVCPIALFYILAREKNIRGLCVIKARLQVLEATVRRSEFVNSEDILWIGQGN